MYREQETRLNTLRLSQGTHFFFFLSFFLSFLFFVGGGGGGVEGELEEMEGDRY